MLIIPVSDGCQRRVPYITFLLILLNCLIFFLFQFNEQQGYMKALSWARTSGLLETELGVYQEYLEQRHEQVPDFLQNTQKSAVVFQHLAQDDHFQNALRQHILIPPADPRFADWFSQRQVLEEKLNQTFAYRFGYSPARKNYIGIFTYMFLHQDVIQLIGNMLFLWFAGAWMEIGIGRFPYIIAYLLPGVFAGLTFGFVYPFSHGPLLGASGAIAGLMGAYLLIYSRARSKVLCSLGFCSGHTAIFGWFLFPFWLTKELYFFFNHIGSQSAYVAHVGGFLVGFMFALVFLLKREKQPSGAVILKDARMEKNLCLSGLELLDKPDLSDEERKAARKKITAALEVEPGNLIALARLFHIDKCDPKTERFHKTAGNLLQHLAIPESCTDIEAYFEEYKRLSDAPRLQPPVMLALAKAYTRSGETTHAARLLLLLLKKRPQYPGLPSSLFQLGCAYKEQQKDVRAEKCFQLICKKYPQTIVSQKAEEQLTPPYGIAIR